MSFGSSKVAFAWCFTCGDLQVPCSVLNMNTSCLGTDSFGMAPAVKSKVVPSKVVVDLMLIRRVPWKCMRLISEKNPCPGRLCFGSGPSLFQTSAGQVVASPSLFTVMAQENHSVRKSVRGLPLVFAEKNESHPFRSLKSTVSNGFKTWRYRPTKSDSM